MKFYNKNTTIFLFPIFINSQLLKQFLDNPLPYDLYFQSRRPPLALATRPRAPWATDPLVRVPHTWAAGRSTLSGKTMCTTTRTGLTSTTEGTHMVPGGVSCRPARAVGASVCSDRCMYYCTHPGTCWKLLLIEGNYRDWNTLHGGPDSCQLSCVVAGAPSRKCQLMLLDKVDGTRYQWQLLRWHPAVRAGQLCCAFALFL